MTQQLHPALSPASCARTVLAAGTWLTWVADGQEWQAPYVDSDGTPLLVVERRMSDALIEAGTLTATSYALPTLGVLRLSGTPWPALGTDHLASVRAFRLQHAECDDCCGPCRSYLVGVRLDRVEFAFQGAGVFETVSVDDFLAAQPDPIMTHGPHVRAHLNADHPEELRVMASRLLAAPLDDIAAASLEWIDALGVDVAVISHEGARTFRFPFRVPLTTMDDLGGQLHRLLHQPGPYPC